MNAILFAGAFLGMLVVVAAADAASPVDAADPGSMTREISVNAETGEVESLSVIAFVD